MAKATTVSFREAKDIALSLASKTPSSCWIPLMQALGKTLSSDLICQKNLPSYDNAALDGYAFRFEDIHAPLRVKKTILAGESVEACLEPHTCYKIMTGAKLPCDADTIAPFEECRVDEEGYVFPNVHVKKGNALRRKGEEQKVGSVLLSQGTRIDARTIALLASQGISYVQVYQALSIVICSTGDELKKPWEYANEDQIYDINAFALQALLQEHGFCASYAGVIPDNEQLATDYFLRLKEHDVILTSGGVSMGDADVVEKALRANGFEASFNGINIKPGKPTMMGVMGKTVVASMPGNPLAAYVNAFLLLIPLLKKMQGETRYTFNTLLASNERVLKLKSGRVNLVLGRLSDGLFCAYDDNRYGSGMITPLYKSNALLLTDEETTLIEAGESVTVISFGGDFNAPSF